MWSNQQTEVGTSGTKGALGNSFSNLSGGNVGKAFLFQASTSHKAVPREGNVFYSPKVQKTALGSDISDRSDRSTQMGEPINKEINTAHLSCDKRHANSSKKKFLKRANLESVSQRSLSSSPPGFVSSASSTHGATWLSPINSSNLGLGNLVQGQSGSHS